MILAVLCGLALCGADVFVMAPLEIFDNDQKFVDNETLSNWFEKLQHGNVDGVMVDVWWGICEPTSKNYKWDGYMALFRMLVWNNLKIVPVMSFHACGGNVGDTYNVPIPAFARTDASAFKDSEGRLDQEYISFGSDDTQFADADNRTPIEMYKDFMTAFKSHFADFIANGHIVEIEVGVGPCGELRYPSYQLSQGWNYPGCGLFQSYDDRLTELLVKSAAEKQHPEWGVNPSNVGDQNDTPMNSQGFWKDNTANNWFSEYGQFFIEWYANVLIDHGRKVTTAAREAFGEDMHLSCKIAGIHWWYMYPCHCAEVTAGFRNFIFHDGYLDILKMFKENNVQCCFTCLEMIPDSTYGNGSAPPYLVQQIIDDCRKLGLLFEGENALEVMDSVSLNRIKNWVPKGLCRYTHLRLTPALMEDANFNVFKQFVNDMHDA